MTGQQQSQPAATEQADTGSGATAQEKAQEQEKENEPAAEKPRNLEEGDPPSGSLPDPSTPSFANPPAKASGLPVEGRRVTIEKQAVLVTTKKGEPRGIGLTEETFEPTGLVVTVSGELDIAAAPVLRDRLTSAIEAGKRRLVIDLSAISFLDSVAWAAIVHAKQRLPEDGKLALVVDASSYAMLVFESGGLAKVLDLVETRARAINHVSR